MHLERCWGRERLDEWLNSSAAGNALGEIRRADLGNPGFPSLVHRIMDTTRPDVVLQFLRELGLHCPSPTRLEIGGSIALILAGVLSRRTEDLDVVDEVPSPIRSQHDVLHQLADRFGLHLTHFQSHYLPAGWKDRLHLLGTFGGLEVLLVDAADVFLRKLFSARMKDRDDLRAMAAHLDKSSLEQRLRQFAMALLAEPGLAKNAADNWYILYGQQLAV